MAVTLAQCAPEAAPRPRRVTILGATGSVGRNTMDLIGRHPERFEVAALTALRNVETLAAYARRFKPQFVAIGDPSRYRELAGMLEGTGVEVGAGPEALIAAAEIESDWTMAAIVGAAGLVPTMAAVRRGGIVALANKECLVCAGELMLEEVRSSGARLLPVDSEHNAIFQVFDTARPETVEKLILTASGGPFRILDAEAMRTVTPAQACAHPNWDMGAKISVDSATMMNKGLEIIEAHHLFAISEPRIEVLVHPQSVVHSMVAYVDGSVLAQMGSPDMRTPIAHTLAWPERIDTPALRLDLVALGRLDFEPPDLERFPALSLARNALKAMGGAPTVLNAANEEAVAAFLNGGIGYLDVVAVVAYCLETVSGSGIDSLDDVCHLDLETRRVAARRIGGLAA